MCTVFTYVNYIFNSLIFLPVTSKLFNVYVQYKKCSTCRLMTNLLFLLSGFRPDLLLLDGK